MKKILVLGKSMPSVRDLCIQRLETIRELERSFDAKNNLNDAWVLRDLWKNWVEQKLGDYIIGEVPEREDIEKRIRKYSEYVDNNKLLPQ